MSILFAIKTLNAGFVIQPSPSASLRLEILMLILLLMSLSLEILIRILLSVTSTGVRVTLIAPSSLVTSVSSSTSHSAEGELSFESIGD